MNIIIQKKKRVRMNHRLQIQIDEVFVKWNTLVP